MVDGYRVYRIAKEKAEFLLTKYSRQRMFAALECLKIDMGRMKINNPAGYLVEFLKAPGEYGYEIDKNGCCVRAGMTKSEKVLVKQYAAEVKPKRKWEEKAKVWQALQPDERRSMIEVLPIDNDFERNLLFKWKNKDQDLSSPPGWIHGKLEELV